MPSFMRMRVTKKLVFVALMLAGCGASSGPAKPPEPKPEQSYEEAISLICDVDRRAGLDPASDPIDVGQKRSDWLADHVKNPDAIYLRTMLSVQSERQQGQALRSEAKGCGVRTCALADSLEQSPLE
jgi:hypothetical protein